MTVSTRISHWRLIRSYMTMPRFDLGRSVDHRGGRYA